MNASPACALREDALRKNDQLHTGLGPGARKPDLPPRAVARPPRRTPELPPGAVRKQDLQRAVVRTPDLPGAEPRPEARHPAAPRARAERRGVAGR